MTYGVSDKERSSVHCSADCPGQIAHHLLSIGHTLCRTNLRRQRRHLLFVSDIRGRVPGRIDRFGLELAAFGALAIVKQVIKIAAIDLEINGSKDRLERGAARPCAANDTSRT
jgi:hypothetical protein